MSNEQQSVNVPEESEFKPADMKEAAGVSYKQLHDWEKKGAIPADKSRGEGWRTFTPKQAFALLVCAEIRKRFGVPVESLRWVQRFMLQEGADHFRYAVETIATFGFSIWLMTDFQEVFIMDSDLEFLDLFQHGVFRGDNPEGYVFLKVNPLVNKLLGCLKAPLELKTSDHVYRQVHEAHRQSRVESQQEFELLRQVRRKDVESVTVNVKGGEIAELYVDEQLVQPGEAVTDEAALRAMQAGDFQTVTVKRHAGRITRLNRRTPIKFPKATGTT